MLNSLILCLLEARYHLFLHDGTENGAVLEVLDRDGLSKRKSQIPPNQACANTYPRIEPLTGACSHAFGLGTSGCGFDSCLGNLELRKVMTVNCCTSSPLDNRLNTIVPLNYPKEGKMREPKICIIVIFVYVFIKNNYLSTTMNVTITKLVILAAWDGWNRLDTVFKRVKGVSITHAKFPPTNLKWNRHSISQ